MEAMKWKAAAAGVLKKYYPLVLAVAAGLILLCLPQGKAEQVQEQAAQSTDNLQEELEEILTRVAGAGKVQVLLTQASGEETYFQEDEDISTDTQRRDTVLYTQEDRSEAGLVRRVDPPKYKGAVVVCQGADKATVRLAITQAVMAATGLSSQYITVLKMK